MISFIQDPTTIKDPGLRVLRYVETVEERLSLPQFSDDSFGFDRELPVQPKRIQSKSFAICVDSTWTLFGQRALFKGSTGFFVDRIYQDNFENFGEMFSVDRSGHIQWSGDGNRYTLRADSLKKVVQVDGNVGLAFSTEPSNWGSFLVRAIPKAIAFYLSGIRKILIYPNNQRHEELFQLFGFSGVEWIEQKTDLGYQVQSGVSLSEPTFQLYLSESVRDFYRLLALRFRSGGTKKIYVSRSGPNASLNSRRCLNEREVERAMMALGFEIVHPQLLSLEEQVRKFSDASFVVGCAGAGMFNAVFCLPGTTVIDIESRSDWLWGHMNLFSSLNLRYGVVWGKPEFGGADSLGPHQAFSVDVQGLETRVKAMI